MSGGGRETETQLGSSELSRVVSAKGGNLVTDEPIGMLDTQHALTIDENVEDSKQEESEVTLDLAAQALKEVKETLGQYNEEAKEEIVHTYDQVNELITHLDTLHSAIIQKHQADFISSYKEHMVKVQIELAEFR